MKDNSYIEIFVMLWSSATFQGFFWLHCKRKIYVKKSFRCPGVPQYLQILIFDVLKTVILMTVRSERSQNVKTDNSKMTGQKRRTNTREIRKTS